ncbi:MAG: sigma 54-interacting transcriptional regulator [Bacteroidetes bacterium]|nr:sigma 54-interacting transcriptional regulator [Bacteroidota bacterium]
MNRTTIKQRFSIIGNCPALNQAIDVAMQVAPTEVSVLVVGENGTGKDVFSRIIHQLSLRKHKTFIAINTGAIPEGTIDSELFGHEKGSFTSAYEARKGYFEEANGGVIFLDEVAEMPLSSQARLLRVLENGEFLRVGSSKVQKTDVRVIAATNKNLIQLIREGKFREDLYFRLNTVTIQVPPLRERGEDIELLFRYFANEFAARYGRQPQQLTPDAKEVLYQYHWPGNIREMRNFVEKLTVLEARDVLDRERLLQYLPKPDKTLTISGTAYTRDNGGEGNGPGFSSRSEEFLIRGILELKRDLAELKEFLLHKGIVPQPGSMDDGYPLQTGTQLGFPAPGAYRAYRDEAETTPLSTPLLEESLSIERKEKDLIRRALEKHGHNRKKAAHELGISERTLYRKIKIFGLDEA